MAMVRGGAADRETLVIDRGAAAEVPSNDAVREWAHGRRAFISSVMAELPAERQAAAEGIRAIGATPVMFELFGGRDASAEDAYIAEVEQADVYVGILGRMYGRPLPTRYSATHTEYRHAEDSGLRIAVWCLRTNAREGPQESFLNEVRAFHVVPTFVTPADLRAQVEDRMKTIAAEDLAPWCKLGSIVFRAAEVADHGSELQVTARIRSDEVAHAIEGLRGERGFRGDNVRFTWAGRSRFVRVGSVKTTTTAARSKMFHLELETRETPHNSMVEMSVNGRSAAELTEAALRTALFQERNLLGDQLLGFMAEMPDPLEPLRAARIADEITRPLAELLITDALVGSGRAERLADFRLGASVGGSRRLKLTWQPRRAYSASGATRTIDGQVRL